MNGEQLIVNGIRTMRNRYKTLSSFLSEKGRLHGLLLVEGVTRASEMLELKKEGL